jgi:hypothetical protein
MVNRVLPLLAVLAVVCLVAMPALADEKAKDLTMHEGKVVSVAAGKLVMSVDGKEHTHTVAADAKVTCDGKNCKLNDLKPGQRVRVWTAKDDAKAALKIAAIDKDKDFPK